MALFRQSSIPWVTAVTQIADSASVSGDTQMQGRAHLSLRAAMQYIAGRTRWDFLRAEPAPQIVTAPFSLGGVSATAGSAYVGLPSAHGLAVYDIVSASGFLLGTRISATAGTGFGVTVAPTAGGSAITGTFIRDSYDAPSDMRNEYGVKLLTSGRPLIYQKRRQYDRSVTDEYVPGTPYNYDLFVLGSQSKIRLIPPPAGSDLLLQRYYRAISIASVSGATSSIDIPEDYEYVPLAWAKWHFLTDKADSQAPRAQTWLSLAQDGLKQMLGEQANLPDDDLTMVPGHLRFWWDTQSTRWINWDYT